MVGRTNSSSNSKSTIFDAQILVSYPDGADCTLFLNDEVVGVASQNPHSFVVHSPGVYEIKVASQGGGVEVI